MSTNKGESAASHNLLYFAQRWHKVSVALVDLDPKPLDKIPLYYQQACAIHDTFAQNNITASEDTVTDTSRKDVLTDNLNAASDFLRLSGMEDKMPEMQNSTEVIDNIDDIEMSNSIMRNDNVNKIINLTQTQKASSDFYLTENENVDIMSDCKYSKLSLEKSDKSLSKFSMSKLSPLSQNNSGSKHSLESSRLSTTNIPPSISPKLTHSSPSSKLSSSPSTSSESPSCMSESPSPGSSFDAVSSVASSTSLSEDDAALNCGTCIRSQGNVQIQGAL